MIDEHPKQPRNLLAGALVTAHFQSDGIRPERPAFDAEVARIPRTVYEGAGWRKYPTNTEAAALDHIAAQDAEIERLGASNGKLREANGTLAHSLVKERARVADFQRQLAAANGDCEAQLDINKELLTRAQRAERQLRAIENWCDLSDGTNPIEALMNIERILRPGWEHEPDCDCEACEKQRFEQRGGTP